MKNRVIKKPIFLLWLILLISSCATVRETQPPDQGKNQVRDLVDSINWHDTETVKNRLATPFLLDTEMLIVRRDVELFWENLLLAGFTLEPAQVTEIEKVEPEDYLLFGESMDTRVFFKKYLPGEAKLVSFNTGSNRYLLLISTTEENLPLIHGMKGPEL